MGGSRGPLAALCKVTLRAPGPPKAPELPLTPAWGEVGPCCAAGAGERGSMRLDRRLHPGRSLRVARAGGVGSAGPTVPVCTPAAGMKDKLLRRNRRQRVTLPPPLVSKSQHGGPGRPDKQSLGGRLLTADFFFSLSVVGEYLLGLRGDHFICTCFLCIIVCCWFHGYIQIAASRQ